MPMTIKPAQIKGSIGRSIRKLPQPEMQPVKSSRGDILKAGKQQKHATEDTIVRARAIGPIITI